MKRFLLIMLLPVLLLCSCSDKEPKRQYLEYEAPLATFINAYNKKDSRSMLACFTPGAIESFGEENDIVKALSEDIESTIGESTRLYYDVLEKQEMDKEFVKIISDEYTDKYSLRLDVKKAYKLKVVISAALGINKKATTGEFEIITIKAGSSWYIYGDVISELGLKSE